MCENIKYIYFIKKGEKMKKIYIGALLFFSALISNISIANTSNTENTAVLPEIQLSSDLDKDWYSYDSNGELKINLYFFWSETCPHCKEAHPFIDDIPKEQPMINIKSHMVTNAGTMDILNKISNKTGVEANSVPYIAYCGKAFVGWGSTELTGKFLVNQLDSCYKKIKSGAKQFQSNNVDNIEMTGCDISTSSEDEGFMSTCGDPTEYSQGDISTQIQSVNVPFLGEVHPEEMSLPMLTIVLAGVDAFNPCAFFVLLFLLSIMVNAKSKGRMLIVGGIFVFFSGLIYFIFMAAWLNIFKLLGAGSSGSYIILGAGVLAVIAGAINVKDYFYTKGKVSLSMSAENRTSLIKRMGKLSNTSSMAAMIGGTTVLAIMANAYELLCTAGFPMIYTSVLSMHELSDFNRYMYLVFYNLVYVIPLAAIVIAFSMTLGKRKLTENEGQTLKLMSGTMMTGLGTTLVLSPESLQDPIVAIGLILGSIFISLIIVFFKKKILKK